MAYSLYILRTQPRNELRIGSQQMFDSLVADCRRSAKVYDKWVLDIGGFKFISAVHQAFLTSYMLGTQ